MGHKVAFCGARRAESSPYCVAPDGGGTRVLAEEVGNLDLIPPVWSPDAADLAFFRLGDEVARDGIRVVRRDGREPRVAADNADAFRGLAWSPGSSGIAYVAGEWGQGDVWVTRRNDAGVWQQENVTSSLGDDHSPAWSPDGGCIAFVTDRDRNQEVYVVDLGSRAQTNLSTHPANDRAPAWRPAPMD